MNLAAGAAGAAALNARKINKTVSQLGFDQATLTMTLIDQVMQLNQHAIVLVNQQIRTNQLLEQLLAKGV